MEKFRRELTEAFRQLYVGDKPVLVFGEGEIGARLMLVGEAPGEKEALEGRPFVGKAGKNLDEFLAACGLDRAQLYVTNAVKFRPVKTSAAGRTVNRPPTREEVALFLPWLKREIALVKPACVVTLGNVPLKALLGAGETIGERHGAFVETNGTRLYPMYHPASLIYNQKLREVYLEDMRRLAEAFHA